MRKKGLAGLLVLGLVFGLAACGGKTGQGTGESSSVSESAGVSESGGSEAEKAKAEEPQKTVRINWARDNSGNAFLELALAKGWLKEEGIEITEKPFDASNDATTALLAGDIDIFSNYGTSGPLQTIASGENLQIIGGYMATGCVPIITRTDNPEEWKGVESLVGKTVASDASNYAIAGPLLEKGYDPKTDVKWVHYPNYSDMTAAVIKGEVDYAVVGSSRNFEVSQQPKLKVSAYLSDLMPWYSCCRMVVTDKYLKENRDAMKKVIKVLLRAQAYYEASDANKEECKKILGKRMNVTEDYLNSYMNNEHFRISVDPLKHEVERGWNILGKTGFLSEGWENIKVDDHIQTELYKEALDEAEKDYGSENPEFYKKMQDFYTEHNA